MSIRAEHCAKRRFRLTTSLCKKSSGRFEGIRDAAGQAYDVSDEKVYTEALNALIRENKPPYMDSAVAMDTDGKDVALSFTDSVEPLDPSANVVNAENYDHEDTVSHRRKNAPKLYEPKSTLLRYLLRSFGIRGKIETLCSANELELIL